MKTAVLHSEFHIVTYRSSPVQKAVEELANSTRTDELGAVYTRPEVVSFMLDLIGYTPDKALYNYNFLEPSVGSGEFLLESVRRLILSTKKKKSITVPELKDCIRGVEVHKKTYQSVKSKVALFLTDEGFTREDVKLLTDHWLVQGDFLLTPFGNTFDFIVGNPPYVRQELIQDALVKAYRSIFLSFYDRADLYVPFIERSLQLLSAKGKLSFICSDRWMKNKYGGPLRGIVAAGFSLSYYIDMVGTDAFHGNVITYPAITVIENKKGTNTRIAYRPLIDKTALQRLVHELQKKEIPTDGIVKEIAGVMGGANPWILESGDQLTLVRRLERDFPLLEETGCKVGIGVATGADRVFIAPYDQLPVESERKLPLATTGDLIGHDIKWKGLGVLNPFTESGELVSLDSYPKFKAYLVKQEGVLKKRHVASKNPKQWFRTIDRIVLSLAKRPKLLIPDIKGEAQIVYEQGNLYPHHNLYYIISDSWNLHALQAVLQSGIAKLFVSTYSTKMRGGYLRFQAQYLRRIRLPQWKDVPVSLKKELISAAKQHDIEACNKAVFKLYGLNQTEREAIGGNGN